MDRHDYYEDLKSLAREKRAYHNVSTSAFGLRELRVIYKAEGIKIDSWPLPPKIKALYMCAGGDYSVAIQPSLPEQPRLFALVHELKHHYRDQDLLGPGIISCGDFNQNELIEKGAEVFSAEFIYPEAEFKEDIAPLEIKIWQTRDVVMLKRNCKAKVSYKYLCKRLERIGAIAHGQFDGVRFQKLEEDLFGLPLYKRINARRSALRR